MAFENFLGKQAGETIWIRDAMSEISCSITTSFHPDTRWRGREAARLSLARTWVEGQAGYFNKACRKHQRRYRLFNRVALVLVGVGFCFPLIEWLTPTFAGQAIPHFKQLAGIVPTIAMLWAALAWNYAELRGYVQEATSTRGCTTSSTPRNPSCRTSSERPSPKASLPRRPRSVSLAEMLLKRMATGYLCIGSENLNLELSQGRR